MTQATDLKLSQLRDIYGFCNDHSINPREVVGNIIDDEVDFEVDGFRFICKDDIDEIQREELASDTYVLGCFNAWFIADILGTSTAAIEKMQKAGAFDGLGEMLLQHIDEVQKNYAAADGYGHHFGRYDWNEYEIGNYYAFRVD